MTGPELYERFKRNFPDLARKMKVYTQTGKNEITVQLDIASYRYGLRGNDNVYLERVRSNERTVSA